MRHSIVAVAAASILACAVASAHGPQRPTRYRVEEIKPPASLLAPCLPQYRTLAQPAIINDLGVVDGNFNCYSQLDPATGTSLQHGGGFVWASWFGGLELRDRDGDETCCSFATTLNHRGEVFGSDVSNGVFEGVKWSLSGGREVVFPNDSQCEVIKLDIAIAGNGRYTLGLGFRPSEDLPFPGFCLTAQWLTRTPSGIVVLGPLRAEPRDINLFNQAIGVQDGRTAFRYQVPSGETRVLRSGDDIHQVLPTDINDAGEVSGYETTLSPLPGTCFTASARALRWDRQDRESVLPLLHGATSSRAWNIGANGDVVGESGPGQYCEPQNSTNERATLWRDGKAIDLNEGIPSHLGITLASANSINRWGQIIAFGYRDDEPLRICPRQIFDEATGTFVLDLNQTCRSQRMYLLTPQ